MRGGWRGMRGWLGRLRGRFIELFFVAHVVDWAGLVMVFVVCIGAGIDLRGYER